MDTDLRIPVTSVQRALIQEATAGRPGGMAEWAREVLLQAARRLVAKRVTKKRGRGDGVEDISANP
jgi:hypothetical protein